MSLEFGDCVCIAWSLPARETVWMTLTVVSVVATPMLVRQEAVSVVEPADTQNIALQTWAPVTRYLRCLTSRWRVEPQREHCRLVAVGPKWPRTLGNAETNARKIVHRKLGTSLDECLPLEHQRQVFGRRKRSRNGNRRWLGSTTSRLGRCCIFGRTRVDLRLLRGFSLRRSLTN